MTDQFVSSFNFVSRLAEPKRRKFDVVSKKEGVESLDF